MVNDLLEASLSAVGRGLLARAKALIAEGKDHGVDKEAADQVFDAAGSVYLKCLVPFALLALHEGVYGRMGIRTNKESNSTM